MEHSLKMQSCWYLHIDQNLSGDILLCHVSFMYLTATRVACSTIYVCLANMLRNQSVALVFHHLNHTVGLPALHSCRDVRQGL